MKKQFALKSAESGFSAYLISATPIFRSDTAQEWGGAEKAKRFKSANAARAFADKWHISAEVVKMSA